MKALPLRATVLLALLAACASPAARHAAGDAYSASDLLLREGGEEDRDATAADRADAALDGDATDSSGAPEDAAPNVAPPDLPDAAPPDLPDAAPPCATGVRCDGVCVDTDTAVAHCGACGRACEAPPGATPLCARGWCGRRCNAGRADCDGDEANGCETDLTADALHCGRCGLRCAVEHGAPRCDMGRCAVAACEAGYDLVAGVCREVLAPRLLAPLSGTQVTSRTPTLRWVAGAGATATVVDVCRDAAMSMGCITATVAATSYRPTTPLAPGPHFWRARSRIGEVSGTPSSRTWEFFVGRSPPSRPVADTSGTPYVDWDGDGLGDLAVAVPGYDPTPGRFLTWQGAAWSTTPPPSSSWDAPVGAPGNFGGAFGPGDYDRDGFTDVAVGWWIGNDRVYAYHGGPMRWRSPSSAPRPLLRAPGDTGAFGRPMSACDIDGDGFQELLIGSGSVAGRAYIHRGSAGGLIEAPTVFHLATGDARLHAGTLVGVGDVDDDGYCDAVATIAPPDVPTRRLGEARLYRGSAAGLEATWTPLTAPMVPFFDSARGGDVDGDGIADAVLGCYGDGMTYGYAAVFRGHRAGTPAPPPNVLYSGALGSLFSVQLVVTDVNGDGLADVIAGAGEGSNVRLYAFHGRVGGPSTAPSASVLVSPLAGANYITLYALSDLDGDGYNEVAVGYGVSPSPGVVRIYAGGPDGLGSTPRWTLNGSSGRDGFGIFVAVRPPSHPSTHSSRSRPSFIS